MPAGGSEEGIIGLGRACEANRFWHTRMPVYGLFDARFSPLRPAISHDSTRRRCRRRASAASRRCRMPSERADFRCCRVSSTRTQRDAGTRSRAARRRNMRASGFGPGHAEHGHVLDRDHAVEAVGEAQRVEHPHRVGARRVGQDVLAARQPRQRRPVAARCRAGAPRGPACDASLPGSGRRGCRGGAPGRAAWRRSAASSAGAARRPPRA